MEVVKRKGHKVWKVKKSPDRSLIGAITGCGVPARAVTLPVGSTYVTTFFVPTGEEFTEKERVENKTLRKEVLMNSPVMSPARYEKLCNSVDVLREDIRSAKIDRSYLLRCPPLGSKQIDELIKEIDGIHARELELRKSSLLIIRTFGHCLKRVLWLQRKIDRGYLGDLRTNDIVDCLSAIKKLQPLKLSKKWKKEYEEEIAKATKILKERKIQVKRHAPAVDETKRVEEKTW